ncbi:MULTISPECIES: enoyl-CoA hydratase [Heyndrickxia]|uniref:Enoyl-CoA hydratase/isomerase n=1 Tax=Heyndrickxia coagulans 36D1 TaxID=345219 RepID=G2TK60_HEYCO|nr:MULTISPECIES: enoyl-CoA hydratase [Heyndrickxia]AEP01061.1 Enoyl-CoA hydratase/isomerase [Heyndrickxia coagulans 36D1]AWP38212.1 enoyl-CoA hydratase [Heyndrickxia coagulans]KGT39602.1 enoyl-CoA hydratase [Heyndrickxia coagulans P38]KYC91156.1 Methylglutaconyl-CoA hydratase [Heyndrickxia coagulans]MEC2304698.1 enoyl-CoA hydratase [Weizmannia sp. CD-2023]
MTGTVLLEKQDGIAVMTLNRSEAANALSKEMLSDMHEVLSEIKKDRSTRVVILTGAGEKVFCAGADLKERKGMNEEEVLQAVRKIGAVVNETAALPQPVIAALNGSAFGGGLELALACDLRIGAREAKYGLTETSLAIIPGAGGTQRLPRLIGVGKAKELIYTARRLTAEEAAAIGLLEYAVPRAAVIEKAFELAGEMQKNGPIALRQAKTAIDQGTETGLSAGLKIEELAYNALIPTEDRLEGLRAFAEKRTPVYKGR